VRLLAIAAVGSSAAVAGSLATSPEDARRLDAFYERVRPPGFWGEPAARRRLYRGCVAIAAAAGTLFASLVGLGTWIVGGTPPLFLPHAPSWIALNLIVAGLLVPVWWSALAAERAPSGD